MCGARQRIALAFTDSSPRLLQTDTSGNSKQLPEAVDFTRLSAAGSFERAQAGSALSPAFASAFSLAPF
jgi:hypothetical protein